MHSSPEVSSFSTQATFGKQFAHAPAQSLNPCAFRTSYDPQCGAAWIEAPFNAILGFNLDLLRRVWQADHALADSGCIPDESGTMQPVRYHITACEPEQAYNLGDDLALFMRLLESQDRKSLLHYAELHADIIHRRLDSFGRPIVTVSVAQGEVLGSGFEAILAADVVIAERSSQIGFPGITYNLFPGMGGYSVLVRKIGQHRAEEMIASGSIFTGAELADLGVVDLLAEDGQGRDAAVGFMKHRLRSHTGYSAMLRARKAVRAITREELQRVATIWADTALKLDTEDLRIMARIVQAQRRRTHEPENPFALASMGHSSEAIFSH